MRASLLTLFAASLAFFGGAVARAQPAAQAVVQFDALVRNYNLVSFGDASFTGGYGDTHGPLAVQGNLTLHGGAVAVQPGLFGVNSNPTLLVGGQLNLTGTVDLNNGYASLNPAQTGTWDAVQRRLTTGGGVLSTINSSASAAANDPRTNAGPAGWDWASVQSSAVGISQTLAGVTPTGTVQMQGQTLTFNANGASGVTVFNLDASLLSGNYYNGQMFSGVQFNIASDALYVVNVTNLTNGQTLFGNGVNFNYASGYERLLWNLLPTNNPTTSIGLGNGGQFYGSVLAPQITLSNANNTAVNGQVVAGSYSHSGAELHYAGFDASGIIFSAVPEPSTYALGAVALCVAGAVWRRRRAAR